MECHSDVVFQISELLVPDMLKTGDPIADGSCASSEEQNHPADYEWSGKKEVLQYSPNLHSDGLVVLCTSDGCRQSGGDAKAEVSPD